MYGVIYTHRLLAWYQMVKDRRLINMVEDKSFNVFLTSCDSYTPACCYYSPSVPAVHRKKKLGMLLYFD